MQNGNEPISRSVLTGYSYLLQKMHALCSFSSEKAMLGAIAVSYNPQVLSCRYYSSNKRENKTWQTGGGGDRTDLCVSPHVSATEAEDMKLPFHIHLSKLWYYV